MQDPLFLFQYLRTDQAGLYSDELIFSPQDAYPAAEPIAPHGLDLIHWTVNQHLLVDLIAEELFLPDGQAFIGPMLLLNLLTRFLAARPALANSLFDQQLALHNLEAPAGDQPQLLFGDQTFLSVLLSFLDQPEQAFIEQIRALSTQLVSFPAAHQQLLARVTLTYGAIPVPDAWLDTFDFHHTLGWWMERLGVDSILYSHVYALSAAIQKTLGHLPIPETHAWLDAQRLRRAYRSNVLDKSTILFSTFFGGQQVSLDVRAFDADLHSLFILLVCVEARRIFSPDYQLFGIPAPTVPLTHAQIGALLHTQGVFVQTDVADRDVGPRFERLSGFRPLADDISQHTVILNGLKGRLFINNDPLMAATHDALPKMINFAERGLLTQHDIRLGTLVHTLAQRMEQAQSHFNTETFTYLVFAILKS